ncbi:hypothetical protein [Siminovitchia terrae]|uniref:hypothetical protein n=1 Tax=Siminovitchia terrae TaxID=1914933 RepID=UPI001BB32450|nr:hypothetical protein [Siminovitchia terrae]
MNSVIYEVFHKTRLLNKVLNHAVKGHNQFALYIYPKVIENQDHQMIDFLWKLVD